MNTRDLALTEIQRWLQTAITHPAGVTESNPHASLGDIILPSRALTSVQRLAIYRNAYYARLLECLRGFFPALSHAIGVEAFDEFAFGYLQKYPSESYTLNRLADRFAKFLEETSPDKNASPEANWPDFLIDLARLEWTIEEVFDGTGNEEGATLSVDALKAIPPDQWPEVRLIPNPSLQLLAFRFPVNDYYTEFRQGRAAEIPTPRNTWVAIHRRDFVVRRHELTRGQFCLLQAIQAGMTLGTAVEAAAGAETANFGEWICQLPKWFQSWTAEQFLTGIEINTQT